MPRYLVPNNAHLFARRLWNATHHTANVCCPQIRQYYYSTVRIGMRVGTECEIII